MNFLATFGYIPILVIIIAGYFLFKTIKEIKKRSEMIHWPTTQGIIEYSEVEQRTARQQRRGRTVVRNYFVAAIRYSYEIMGFPFQSDSYSNTGGNIFPINKKQDAEKMLSNYPIGKNVTITYNPDAPAECYLVMETSLKTPNTQKIILITLIAASIVWLAFWAISGIGNNPFQKKSETAMIPNSTGIAIEQANTYADSYGMKCSQETYGEGKHAYADYSCETPDSENYSEISVMSRQNDPDKVDFVLLSCDSAKVETVSACFAEGLKIAFSGEDLLSAQNWVESTLPNMAYDKSFETTINSTHILMNATGVTYKLNIGTFQ